MFIDIERQDDEMKKNSLYQNLLFVDLSQQQLSDTLIIEPRAIQCFR